MSSTENKPELSSLQNDGEEKPVVRLEVEGENVAEDGYSENFQEVGIERDINKQTVKRKWMRKKDPDASLLQIEHPVQKSPEDTWQEQSRVTKARWIIGGVLIMLCLLGVVVLWAIAKLDKGSDRASQELVELNSNRRNAEVMHKEAVDIVEEIERLTKGFVEAKSLDQMAKYVRDSERVKPLMVKYYENHPFKVQQLVGIDWQRVPVEVENRLLWVISYEVAGSDEKNRLLIEQSPDDSLAVDWESNVVYQPMDWDEFRERKMTEPQLFRVYLELMEMSPFYGFEFSDYKKYRAFKITIKDREGYLWGYTVQGDEADNKLVEMALREKKNGGKQQRLPVMVKLRFLKNSMSDRCVVIDELVGTTWTLIDAKNQLK